MRSFIAISLPTNDLLVRVLTENKLPGKSIEGKNLHLTLKFLGDIRDVEGIRTRLKGIDLRSFRVTLKGLGAFPNAQNGRVLFVKAFPEDVLKELAEMVNSRTREIPMDHPFTPHITLLRVRDRKDFSDVISRYRDTIFLEHEVTSFSFFESILRPTGSIYNEIQRYQLM